MWMHHWCTEEKIMRKLISLFFVFIVSIISTFADTSKFYKNNKVIDIMYVNSEDGLRVRDYPSLESNRIYGLTHGLPVKIISIGKEVIIDGIKAPWVEIALPGSEWIDGNPKYGWVFGGYLSENKPEFISPKTKTQLEHYFSSHVLFQCILNDQLDGKYYLTFDKKFITTGINDFIIKKYNIVDANHISMMLYVDRGKKDYRIFNIRENSFSMDIEGKIVTFNEIHELINPFSLDIDDISLIGDPMVYLIVTDSDYYRLSNVFNLTKDDFIKKYNNYWEPIIKDHQKKADAMK